MTRDTPGWSTLLGLGAVTALLLILGLGLGWLVDRALHTFPIFAFVGLALGIAWGVRYTYVEFRKSFKD